MRKTLIHVFTIADYEDEEIWLRKQHMNGWKLVKITPPCLYTFESCEPQDVIYRLDHKNRKQSPEYIKMAEDFGWEYLDDCFGWLYFRKKNLADKTHENNELFSDNKSKIEFVDHIIKTRLIPVNILFLISLILSIPYSHLFSNFSDGTAYQGFGLFSTILFGVCILINATLTAYCSIKLKKIKDKYKE